MSGLKRLPIEDTLAFLDVLSRNGLTAACAASVVHDESLARSMVAGYAAEVKRREELLRYQRSMFTYAAYQLKAVRKWNQERKWGFTDKQFRAVRAAIPKNPNSPLVCVVLVPYLDTAERTHDELWACAAARQPQSRRWETCCENVESYDHEITYYELKLSYGETHVPGLRWETINLGAHIGEAPATHSAIQCPLPHAGVLAAAALHPVWAARMNGDSVPFVWLPGYRVTAKTHYDDHIQTSDSGLYVPTLSIMSSSPHDRGSFLQLEYDSGDKGKVTYAVPTFHPVSQEPRT